MSEPPLRGRVRDAMAAELIAEAAALVQPPPVGGDDDSSAVLLDVTGVHERIAMMRARSDVAAFPLTSQSRGLAGRASLRVRTTLRRLMFQVLHRQQEYNDAGLVLTAHLAARSEQDAASLRVTADVLARLEQRVLATERRLAEVRSQSARLIGELERIGIELESGLARLTALDGESSLRAYAYIEHQAQFRGTRAEIAERQSRYLDLLRDQGEVIDIGCGRGELLELLRSEGIEARGVDLDEGMIAVCRSLDLDVTHADGLAYLDGRDDSSLGAVFAAQVVEHLAPARIVRLLQVAHRKLRPGGVLILETPDPRSLVTFASFYLDLTHVKPVHPLALRWLAEQVGFSDVTIEQLSPAPAEHRLVGLPGLQGVAEDELRRFNVGLTATDVLLYDSQEYALVARRA